VSGCHPFGDIRDRRRVPTVRRVAGINQVVGANVRGHRARRDITQAQLGEVLAMSQRAVSRLERGETGLRLDQIPALCRLLDVGVPDLLRGADAADLAAMRVR
jgi:transcriptional regulator with XRE-family HTH domain